MDNEEEIALLKRVIVYITRPPNMMSDQAKEDVALLEQRITDLGGDTRNDLRALAVCARCHSPDHHVSDCDQ